MFRKNLIGLVAAAVVALTAAGTRVHAQGGAALTGTVSSQKEGKMEGVLVTARGEGANHDVTVVTNASGQYSFPRTHLKPGKYALKIRAVGYDLATANPAIDVVAGKTGKLDLSLDSTKDLSSQITSVEWLMSIPGTDEQKNMVQKQIASCTYCHSMERIIKSRHNAEQMVNVIHRMSGYYFDGTMAGTEGRGRARPDTKQAQEAARKNPTWGFFPGVAKTELAAYLATVNRSGGRELPELKTLPRPKGKATRVIITQYDLPRKDTVPHDSDVDSKGNIWYTDQSDYWLGRLDPKTGEFKEWQLPKPEHHEFGGGSDIAIDKKDRPWFTLTHDKVPGHFGMPGRFDPQTGKFEFADLGQPFYSQFNATAPDGSIIQGNLKIDADSMKLLDTYNYQKAPNTPPGQHAVYEPAADSKGNWYGPDFGSSYIVKVTPSKEVKWIKTPIAFSQPRRGRIDSQDRFWFAEYTGDAIAMIDQSEKIKEWPVGKWYAPYTASRPNKNGHVFAPSNTSDRIFRLDPKSGELVGYLMPTRDFDTKQVAIDPIDNKSLWFANVRNARIVKVEPLD
jgi:virginiamycin B lyase